MDFGLSQIDLDRMGQEEISSGTCKHPKEISTLTDYDMVSCGRDSVELILSDLMRDRQDN